MKKLAYAGTEVITGDEIAIAVLRYCEALAEADAAEVVEIPVLAPDGSRVSATFVVGPASQMIAVDVATDGPEIVDPEVVARLVARTRAQRPVVHGSGQDSDEDGDSSETAWHDDY